MNSGEDQAAGDTEDVLMGSLRDQGTPVLLEVSALQRAYDREITQWLLSYPNI